MHTLRWKLALLLLNYIPLAMYDSVFVDIRSATRYSSWFNYSWGDITHTWKADVRNGIAEYVCYFLAVIVWIPISCVTYFLLSTYQLHFPESLI